MIIQNKSMSAIKDDIIEQDEKYLIIGKVSQIINKLEILNDCLIVYSPTFDINDEEKFKLFFGDEIGFEASQNEIDLTHEFDAEDKLSKSFVFLFFESFNKELKEKYPDRTFCSIISLDDLSGWIFRFHTVRDNKLWIDRNIDNYSEPLAYEIF